MMPQCPVRKITVVLTTDVFDEVVRAADAEGSPISRTIAKLTAEAIERRTGKTFSRVPRPHRSRTKFHASAE